MSAAINVYKEEKAKNTPDLNEIQSQLAQAQKAALTAEIQRAGTLEAITMGIDVKTAPYILKMADMSGVTGEDGKLNQEALKNAIAKVLEDIPQLKPQAAELKALNSEPMEIPETITRTMKLLKRRSGFNTRKDDINGSI